MNVIHTCFNFSDNVPRGLPCGLPRPDKIPLPDLSPGLHAALQSGMKETMIFNRALKETEIFYLTKYPSMSDSSFYQSIGKRMVEKYPPLAYADGRTPWVSIKYILQYKVE